MFFSKLSAATETLDQPGNGVWSVFGSVGGKVNSGQVVNGDTAMKVSTVLACIRVITEDLGKLPLVTYRRKDGDSREKARNHGLYRLLRRKPNKFQTAYIFKAFMQSQVLRKGNAYAVIFRNGSGEPEEIVPTPSDRVTVLEADEGELFYRIRDKAGREVIAPADDVIHLKNPLSNDGKVGLSMISLLAETIGMSMAAEKYGASFFGNGARPGGYLSFKDKLSREAKEAVRQDWTRIHSGTDKAHTIAILTEGAEFKSTGDSHDDMQFLETRTFQAYQICGVFRVAPHLVGVMDKATFTNIEHQGQQHANTALLPWAVMWEEELFEKLLFDDERDDMYIEFNFDSVVRADFKTRMEGYKTAIGNSIMSPNEARKKENLPSVTHGEDLYMPLNMAKLGSEQPNEASRPADSE